MSVNFSIKNYRVNQIFLKETESFLSQSYIFKILEIVNLKINSFKSILKNKTLNFNININIFLIASKISIELQHFFVDKSLD